MSKPIIDPSTLTEEQRIAILEIWRTKPSDFKAAYKESIPYAMGISTGSTLAVVQIFGKELFNGK